MREQNAAARATLTEVMRKYPGSDSAKLAAERAATRCRDALQ